MQKKMMQNLGVKLHQKQNQLVSIKTENTRRKSLQIFIMMVLMIIINNMYSCTYYHRLHLSETRIKLLFKFIYNTTLSKTERVIFLCCIMYVIPTQLGGNFMQYRKFGNKYFLRIDKGEEVISKLKEFCTKENIKLAEVRALGASDNYELAVFDVNTKKYASTKYNVYSEISSLWGTVTTMNGEFYSHIHMTAGTADGKTYGGHLVSVTISATCEMIVEPSEGIIERKFNDEVGLNLFEFVD